jgi:uncharacterized membrane protein
VVVTIHIKNEFLAIGALALLLLPLVAAGVQGVPAPLPMLRLFLGLAYVLLAPGYSLQAALFPREDDLDAPERLALSFGLSVAIIAPLALVLDALPWGIRLWPIFVGEALVIAACAAVALYRRSRLPECDRPQFILQVRPGQWWAEQDATQRRIYRLLWVALLLFSLGAAAIILTPKPGQQVTEFYLLGPEGLAQDYPRSAVAGQTVSVTVGIANHEGVSATYRVDVRDASGKIGEVGPVALQAEEVEEAIVAFAPRETGEDVKVEFFLYRDDGTEAYRSLHLWMEVTAEALGG